MGVSTFHSASKAPRIAAREKHSLKYVQIHQPRLVYYRFFSLSGRVRQLWNTCEMARRDFKTNVAAGVRFLKMLIVIREDSRKMSASRKDRRLSSPSKVNCITCSSLFRYLAKGSTGYLFKIQKRLFMYLILHGTGR